MFDGQVVRLQEIADLADDFVRVRLNRIDTSDLSVFDFDYDLTFMVFFLDSEQRVYARYGGRDANDPDAQQSLTGLRHAMQTVLDEHRRSDRRFAPRRLDAPKFTQDFAMPRVRGGCIHCHEVREMFNAELVAAGEWSRDKVWRFPPPDNLGLTLDVDRGNVAAEIRPGSPAERAGLQAGDVVERLGDTPIRTYGDAQYALDGAPSEGSLSIAWRRGDASRDSMLELPRDWRRTDILWRRSLQEHVPHLRLTGDDLSAEEKRRLGLPPDKMAFRQRKALGDDETGFRKGDVILDIDGRGLDVEAYHLREHVARRYVVGERIVVKILRDGQPREIEHELTR